MPTAIPAKQITSISAQEAVMNLKVGDNTPLKLSFDPADASLSDCSITNSKDYVASVDDKGNICAKYIGTTFITVASKQNPGTSTKIKVNVTDDFSVPADFGKYNSDIMHGKLTDFNYPSDYRNGGEGHALIWFPADYDPSKQYNLLLCLHGGSDTEYYWTSKGSGSNDGCNGDIVLDNLYATGQMEETIVVFPHGVINYNASKDYPDIVENPFLTDFWKNHYLLEFEIVNNLLPYIKENYPVKGDSAHTAVCGLSMGCAQSMELGFKHSELFDYVGCFSAGPFEDTDQFFVNSTEDADKINNALKLLFFITGENDHLHDDSLRNFVKSCNEYDLNNIFYEVKGVGHDDYCWDKALYTFMRYAFK